MKADYLAMLAGGKIIDRKRLLEVSIEIPEAKMTRLSMFNHWLVSGQYGWPVGDQFLTPLYFVKAGMSALVKRQHWQLYFWVLTANLSFPVWTYQGVPFNGCLRLTKAFMRGKTEIDIREWETVPNEAIVQAV